MGDKTTWVLFGGYVVKSTATAKLAEIKRRQWGAKLTSKRMGMWPTYHIWVYASPALVKRLQDIIGVR